MQLLSSRSSRFMVRAVTECGSEKTAGISFSPRRSFSIRGSFVDDVGVSWVHDGGTKATTRVSVKLQSATLRPADESVVMAAFSVFLWEFTRNNLIGQLDTRFTICPYPTP